MPAWHAACSAAAFTASRAQQHMRCGRQLSRAIVCTHEHRDAGASSCDRHEALSLEALARARRRSVCWCGVHFQAPQIGGLALRACGAVTVYTRRHARDGRFTLVH